MDKPEANRPLTGDDVKLLKAGDVLQPLDGRRGFSFVDRNRVLFLRAAEQTPELIYTDIAGPVMADRFVFVSRPVQPEPERDGAETRNAEVSMLAYRWMEAHDKLKAGEPYDLPSPADLPNVLSLLSTAERQRDAALTYIERLGENIERNDVDMHLDTVERPASFVANMRGQSIGSGE